MDRLGIAWKSASLDEIRVAYIRMLREEAAGRGSSELSIERARLAREQADKVAMQNAVTRGELAPVVMINEVLSKAAARVAGIFDAIPGQLKRRFPELSSDALSQIAGEIAKVRNVVAAMSLADLAESSADAPGGDEPAMPDQID